LHEFAHTHADSADKCAQALKQQDWGRAAALAHSLSGVAAHIGAESVQFSALDLELSARDGVADWPTQGELARTLAQLVQDIVKHVPTDEGRADALANT
jgi:two-component system, sensor histidine kinase and response regulator